MSEADIHFDFYRYLENEIEANPNRGKVTYGYAKPEYTKEVDGRADIVVFDESDDPLFVIEAKRPGGGRNIDPFSPSVIKQAFGYAGDLGAPFFCTYNEDRFVIFAAFEEGVPLLQRKSKSYTVSDPEQFAGTLLEEISRINAGTEDWDSLDTFFIERIRSLHEFIAPELRIAVTEEIENNNSFKLSFKAWSVTNGHDWESASDSDREDIITEFAEQAAYLLINKILFYKILEQSLAYGDEINPLDIRRSHLREDLNEHFEQIVHDIDFEAVYEHDEIYSEIPVDRITDRVRDFILELEERDLTQFDSDVIGRIYERVIPTERRREYGEYYTPPAVTDLITQLTIDSGSADVLDPACGSGGFLISAYKQLQSNLVKKEGSHERLLNQIHGVEINRFPAHLSAINLAIQDFGSYTEDVNIRIQDFFDVSGYGEFGGKRAGTGGSEQTDAYIDEDFGGFDAIVGNPPYIRQEAIPDKNKVRDHLDNEEVDAEYISKRSDIYSYFVTHATEFLSQRGKIGFITSDRWLDTNYGADLQQFLLEHHRVEAVIKFDRQTFTDALVGSVVFILRKEEQPQKRDENVAKFLRIQQSMDVDEIVDIVENDHPANQLVKNERYRLVTQKQDSLQGEDKWSRFFIAPSIYFELENSPTTNRLGDMADLSYGIKSGANKFFLGRTEEMYDLGLEPYTRPLLKASGQVQQISFEGEQAKEWVILDIDDTVKEARKGSDSLMDDSPARRVKEWFRNNDHELLAEYIDWGEEQGYDTNATCQQRQIWFNLGEIEVAPMLIPRFAWRENVVVWNTKNGVGTTQFYNIYPDKSVNNQLLCACLNSRLAWLSREIEGRQAGGQGMTRNEVKVYEAKQMLVPNLHSLSEDERESITDAFRELKQAEKQIEKSQEDDPVDASEEQNLVEDERDALDKAVMEAIGFEDRVGELETAVETLLELREKESGEATEVLVDEVDDETEVIDLAGVSDVRESTTLDDF